MSTGALQAALEELRGVLEASLPSSAWDSLPRYFERARDELARHASPQASKLPGTSRHGSLALDYVSALLAGNGS